MLNGHKVVSLCTSRLNDVDNIKFIMELNNGLKDLNALMFIYNINTDLYWSDDNIRADSTVFSLIDFAVTDVVIIMYERIKNKSLSAKIIKAAQQHNVPVIIVDGVYEGCTSICFDYKKGFEEVVRHVIEFHGARNPHFLAGFKGNVFSDDRIDAFKKVIEENGIKFTEDMVSYGDFWSKPAREAVEALLASGKVPDAIICANDIMAINACSVLFKHGYNVPDDVIVTGFDGIEEINLTIPRVTTSYCGSAATVPTIIEALDVLFENSNHIEYYSVDPKLMINNSCGCDHINEKLRDDIIRSFNDRFYRYQDDNIVLANIAESMQTSSNIVECACKLFDDAIKDMTCIINKDCINGTKNYFAGNRRKNFADEMFLFFDNDLDSSGQHIFKRRDIVPNLDSIISIGNPLIFNVISYLNIPLGYVCFHFSDYSIVDYCKIPQIVNTLGSGIGGFVNMQYQLYLTNRIEKMYKYDSLTGLYNRLSFNNEFEQRKRTLGSKKYPITVILADLDGLKYINDNYGHGAGDNAIRTVATALKESAPEDALCVRFGGDEMLAVITGECDPEQIKSDINRRLRNYNSTECKPYLIAASVGIFCTDSTQNTDFELLVKETDVNMYAEKMAKRGQKV